MDLNIPDELEQLRRAVRQMLRTGDAEGALFNEGTSSASARTTLLAMLDDFGLAGMDARNEPSETLAAALVMQELGAAKAAVPAVAATVARAAGTEGLLHAIGRPSATPLLNHVDLDLLSFAIDLEGNLYRVTAAESPDPARRPMAPYSARVTLERTGEQLDPWTWSLSIVLSAFWALGAAENALELAVEHVSSRVQFGQPLAGFQGVRNRIAEIVIRLHGLNELALYTVWRLGARPDVALVDSLLLRYQHLLVTREILASVHQLHGSTGFCYEYPLAEHTLGLQYDRQVPFTEPETMTELVKRYRDIETNYEVLPPAWNLYRTDTVSSVREPASVG